MGFGSDVSGGGDLPGMHDCAAGMLSGALTKRFCREKRGKPLSKPEARGAALTVHPIYSNEPPNSVYP